MNPTINLTVIICNMTECAYPEGGTGFPTSYAPVCFVFGTRVFVAGVELFTSHFVLIN
jgi:hypothetical protein